MAARNSNAESLPTDSASEPAPSLVVLGLVTWAALVTGIVVTLGGFADPRPMHNGWVRLMTLAAILWGLVWAARVIHAQRAQLLKLALVASLIAHTMLAAILYRQRIEFRAEPIIVERAETEARKDLAANSQEHLLSSESRVVAGASALKMSRGLPLSRELAPQRQQTVAPQFELPSTAPTIDAGPSLGAKMLLQRGSDPLAVSSRRRPLDETAAGALAAAPSVQKEAIELPPMADLPNTYALREIESRLVPVSEPLKLKRLTTPLAVGVQPPSVARPNRSAAAKSGQAPAKLTPIGEALDAPRSFDRRFVERAPLPAADRFAMRFSTLPAAGSTKTRQPSQAFARRVARRQPVDQSGMTNLTQSNLARDGDLAIERGLQFVARVQLDDGRWEFEYQGPSGDSEPVSVQADAAATGLALLSFLGAGYDHFDGRYRHSVQHGLDYLCRIQATSGELFPESDQAVGQVTRFYSHGLATLALCEAYGMTGDPRLRKPATAAIEYLGSTQHPELGGWRYVVGTNADLSVTGWQFLAIRSAELAGLQVSPQVYGRVEKCLEQCRDESGDRALFRYNPWASPTDLRTRHGREPSTVMTSVGLLMHLHLKPDRSSQPIQVAADHLLANLPQQNPTDELAPTGTIGNPGRDTYYWYYATQAMYQLGGERWRVWRERLFPLLIASQETEAPLAGSWDPRRPGPDKWAPYAGRLYVTTMNLLSLEVAYRSLLSEWRATPRVAEGR